MFHETWDILGASRACHSCSELRRKRGILLRMAGSKTALARSPGARRFFAVAFFCVAVLALAGVAVGLLIANYGGSPANTRNNPFAALAVAFGDVIALVCALVCALCIAVGMLLRCPKPGHPEAGGRTGAA